MLQLDFLVLLNCFSQRNRNKLQIFLLFYKFNKNRDESSEDRIRCSILLLCLSKINRAVDVETLHRFEDKEHYWASSAYHYVAFGGKFPKWKRYKFSMLVSASIWFLSPFTQLKIPTERPKLARGLTSHAVLLYRNSIQR